MGDYVIITDSTADFSSDMINQLEIEVLPLKFTIAGETYGDYADGRDMKIEEFYKRLRSGETPVTSQINPDDFVKVFKRHLDNKTDILYIAFSSGLSGTYSSAIIAADELKHQYPDRKIIIVDSLCASLGEGLLVYLAVKEKRNGTDIENLGKWLENKKKNICHWFTVDDLHHLHRGGRVSAASALFGSMLSIKPILHVDNVGKLVLVSKTRGRKKSIEALIERLGKTGVGLENQEIFISHGDCEEDAQEAAYVIKNKYGVKNIFLNMIGPIIGSHAGPGTLAVFFLGTER